ncbi:MAG: hypothetical protein FWH24_03335 [Oscillospiraceae bacterium]|nr:hypothetical protein [Oscillospiraceae bacterium]
MNEEIKQSDSVIKSAVILGILAFSAVILLSVLNSFTNPVILNRLKAEKEEYVKKLFGENISMKQMQGYENLYLNYEAEITDILLVWSEPANGEPAKYCVVVLPEGKSGGISMFVAVGWDGAVIDAEISNAAETDETELDPEVFLSCVNTAAAVVSDIMYSEPAESDDSVIPETTETIEEDGEVL